MQRAHVTVLVDDIPRVQPSPRGPAPHGGILFSPRVMNAANKLPEEVPLQDYRDDDKKATRSQAEQAIHLIPVVVLSCGLILYLFSVYHTVQEDILKKDDSVLDLKASALPGANTNMVTNDATPKVGGDAKSDLQDRLGLVDMVPLVNGERDRSGIVDGGRKPDEHSSILKPQDREGGEAKADGEGNVGDNAIRPLNEKEELPMGEGGTGRFNVGSISPQVIPLQNS